MKNKNFFKSFIHAADGIKAACRDERNMRCHMVVAVLTAVFAYFYGLTGTQWAILLVSIFSVLAAELVNTAVERAVDTATDEFRETAKIAKDTAAASVLVTAIGAVLIGICLFGDFKRITYTLGIIFTEPKNLALCTAALLLCIVFLILTKRKGN